MNYYAIIIIIAVLLLYDLFFCFQDQGGSGLQYHGQYEQPVTPHASHEQPHITVHSPSSSPPLSPQSPAKYCANLRVISPSNKKEFSMFTLRDLTVDSVNSYENLKDAIISQVGDAAVADADKFQMGFF